MYSQVKFHEAVIERLNANADGFRDEMNRQRNIMTDLTGPFNSIEELEEEADWVQEMRDSAQEYVQDLFNMTNTLEIKSSRGCTLFFIALLGIGCFFAFIMVFAFQGDKASPYAMLTDEDAQDTTF